MVKTSFTMELYTNENLEGDEILIEIRRLIAKHHINYKITDYEQAEVDKYGNVVE